MHGAAQLQVEGIGCYGKLPLSREFVAEGSVRGSAGLDRWLEEGVGLAKSRLAGQSTAYLGTFPRYRFSWNDGRGQLLAGVICPSQDAAARAFPFALFASLRGQAPSAVEAALQVHQLQEDLAHHLGRIAAATDAASVRAVVQDAGRAVACDPGAMRERYQRALDAPQPADLWAGHRAADAASDPRHTVMQALVETLTPPGGDHQRAYRGGVRYPLPRDRDPAADIEGLFWLDLSERVLGRSLLPSCWFRAPGEPTHDRRHLYVFLSAPSGVQWLGLIDQTSSLESISALDQPYGTRPAAERMAPALRALVEAPTTTLRDYLHWATGS